MKTLYTTAPLPGGVAALRIEHGGRTVVALSESASPVELAQALSVVGAEPEE